MERKQYRVFINAPRERVWEVLWGEHTYPQWTSAFAEGSRVETNWEKGGKAIFLNAKNEGMISQIAEKKEPEKMVFKHLGMLDENGKEDYESEKVKAWKGAEEIYLLEDENNQTRLTVEMDIAPEYESHFDEIWPKVFKSLKSLAETGNQKVTVQTRVKAPVEKAWLYWTNPQHIKQWNFASDTWHCPAAENDLRENGKFSYRMEAKDAGTGFDFEGVYNKIDLHRHISYTIEDGRKVQVDFERDADGTAIREVFDAESTHPIEMQKNGWQAILNNFKQYVENNEQ